MTDLSVVPETFNAEPLYFLNYRGDKRGMRNPVGPNTLGETLLPVDAEYNPDTDMTRVGFTPVHLPDGDAK